jgi:phage replication-related protein YjqB (UPF0714/DUF867 family)
MTSAKRPDKYSNFKMLSLAERADDFRIEYRPRPSTVAIIAPHGGKIELGTSAIAAAIAADDYCFYSFEGRKRGRNWDLHITSTHFDEPQCLRLVERCDYVVAVHGRRGSEQTVYLGGLDLELRDAIRDRLDAAGITTSIEDDLDLQGKNTRNICNRGRRRRGVQLEITKGVRSSLIATAARVISSIMSSASQLHQFSPKGLTSTSNVHVEGCCCASHTAVAAMSSGFRKKLSGLSGMFRRVPGRSTTASITIKAT